MITIATVFALAFLRAVGVLVAAAERLVPTARCACHLEPGDSPCQVHGEEEPSEASRRGVLHLRGHDNVAMCGAVGGAWTSSHSYYCADGWPCIACADALDAASATGGPAMHVPEPTDDAPPTWADVLVAATAHDPTGAYADSLEAQRHAAAAAHDHDPVLAELERSATTRGAHGAATVVDLAGEVVAFYREHGQLFTADRVAKEGIAALRRFEPVTLKAGRPDLYARVMAALASEVAS